MERRPEQFQEGAQIAGTAYQVKALIGSGGMGSVYEVEHLELGRLFVLKALHGHLSSRSDLVGRMRNEWRALAKLNHPHIVQVTDAGQTTSGLPYYVMERLEGRTLGQLLAESGRLGLRRASEIIIDVLKGLDAAHATGAIHRDIKPQNIFVQGGGVTKLLDFGIAKLRDRAARVVTAGGISIGTPRYMAPEQAEGGTVDGRADIYAAGLVLYECVLGRGPFAHIRDPNMLVMAHIGEEPERVDYLDASIPPELGDLLHRWLSKFPSSRPATAGLAAFELESLLPLFPGECDDSDDVTLGGDYDASTVGAVQLISDSQAPGMPPASGRGQPSRPGLTPEAIKPGAARSSPLARSPVAAPPAQAAPPSIALTPTVTIGDPEPIEKRPSAGTLGWGTQIEETAPGPVPRKRSSKTPPPISSIAAKPVVRSLSRRWGVIAATSLGSFCLGWIILGLFSDAQKPDGGEGDASQVQLNAASGEGPNLESLSTSATRVEEPGANNTGITPSAPKPIIRAPSSDARQKDEQIQANGEVGQEPATKNSPSVTEASPSSSASRASSGAVGAAQPAKSSPAPGPPAAPRPRVKPAESPREPRLPGSGLW